MRVVLIGLALDMKLSQYHPIPWQTRHIPEVKELKRFASDECPDPAQRGQVKRREGDSDFALPWQAGHTDSPLLGPMCHSVGPREVHSEFRMKALVKLKG